MDFAGRVSNNIAPVSHGEATLTNEMSSNQTSSNDESQSDIEADVSPPDDPV